MTFYEDQYTPEQKKLAEQFIEREKAGLDKWFKGDTSGYEEIWSKTNFTYFDAVVSKRIESREELAPLLDNIRGKLFADTYEFKDPRVQFGVDTGLFTYQLFAKTNLIDMQYNVVQHYQKEANGEWHVIHSTWSFIRPMEVDFSRAKCVV